MRVPVSRAQGYMSERRRRAKDELVRQPLGPTRLTGLGFALRTKVEGDLEDGDTVPRQNKRHNFVNRTGF